MDKVMAVDLASLFLFKNGDNQEGKIRETKKFKIDESLQDDGEPIDPLSISEP